MNINPQAASLAQKDVQQAAMTQADIEAARKSEQHALEVQQMLSRLEERRITPSKELPKMEFLFRLFHKPCFRSQVLSVERIEPKRLHVLWYDTEQSEESTQDILRSRIIPMTGISEDQFPTDLFDVFNVRPEGYANRLPMLEAAVSHYHPDLVILDGIRDLVADINDGVVAQDCIERLMHLASDNRCCIVCILHQNKSVDDRNLRGWIGTELKNKAFEVYESSKSSERIFTWSQTDTRKYDILDTLKFAVGDDGIPYLCSEEQLKEAMFNAQKKVAEQRQREGSSTKLAPFNPKYVAGKENHKTIFKVRELFTDSMEPGKQYYEDELLNRIGLASNIVTEKILSEQLTRALNEGILLQSRSALNGKKIYMLHQQAQPVPTQQTLNFDENTE